MIVHFSGILPDPERGREAAEQTMLARRLVHVEVGMLHPLLCEPGLRSLFWCSDYLKLPEGLSELQRIYNKSLQNAGYGT